ncbi:AMP-binding protein [Herbidospora sp. NBRC 101105]|uniref:AMP-binding protein n=1 Tax=Herbidospora sp. NBRC 101105 TaxID=3032195 RepID=UPI0024A235F1|nr:AMP-binding protein [Herbidospora sp. NBRC 101105]GLX98282.1 acyl-CoA synthetase [Herbidospora sp. NBRC 101105]
MTQFDLATLHEAIAAAVPDRECLVWRDRRCSWRETTERTRRLGNLLHARGLGPGARMAVYLHNGPEYLEALLGAHKARVTPFNVNYRYTADELAYLFADAGPAVVVFHAAFAPLVAKVAPPSALLLQVADDSGHPLVPGALPYEEALAAASPEPVPVAPSPDDHHIIYTGGTTGMPKGVVWRIGDLLDGPVGVRRRDGSPFPSLAALVEHAAASRRRILPAAPLMHGTGVWFTLNGWCLGSTVVIADRVDRFDAPSLLATLERERVTGTVIVGDAFARPLVEELQNRVYDLRLGMIGTSGAFLGEALRARLAELIPGVRTVDTLGSSETGNSAVRMDGGRFEAGPWTVVLSADQTRVLSPGDPEEGWLARSGPIPLGYLGDPEKTARTFRTVDGVRYAVPGDRAVWREDGTVDLHGREATVINTAGEKVFAEEVEGVLREVEGVVDALVVGRPSERWGQEVVAVVQTREPGEPDDATLKSACAARLAGFKVPKAFVRADRVRRHANGKADYAWARSMV